MGRGRSNYTKLYWAMKAYSNEYDELYPRVTSRGSVYKKVERQLKASRWFKKHFLALISGPAIELDSLGYELSHDDPVNLIRAWFYVADSWPLDTRKLSINPKDPKTSNSNRYRYLYFEAKLAGTEVEHRMRANLFLVLIQHFLGREQAKLLLKHYKKHKVKYRKIRGDKGTKLTGEDLIEFKMRLGGHSLLIGRLEHEDNDEK